VDVVTSGNHVWEKRDFWPALETEARMLRPANYPEGAPGHGYCRMEKAGIRYLVINLQGRELMTPIDCPFKKFDAILASEAVADDSQPPPFVIVDFHAETTREKEALGYYVDGRAGIFAGTHTHVQTADERILPAGTAYITDLGMTGPTDSVIGMDAGICLDRVRTQIAYRMTAAAGLSALHGLLVEFDGATLKPTSVRRLA
jgi:metallophosphoesterase (TIGR00282 family)